MRRHECRGSRVGRGYLLFMLLLIALGVVVSVPFEGQAETSAVVVGSGSQEKTVAGEYIVLFHAKSRITTSTGETRRALAALMLEMQGEYLANRYGLVVLRTYDAIAETTGKGMFHVRSDLAAKDQRIEEKLRSLLEQDLLIESVTPNREQKLISTP
jgi:hypothetical protein